MKSMKSMNNKRTNAQIKIDQEEMIQLMFPFVTFDEVSQSGTLCRFLSVDRERLTQRIINHNQMQFTVIGASPLSVIKITDDLSKLDCLVHKGTTYGVGQPDAVEAYDDKYIQTITFDLES